LNNYWFFCTFAKTIKIDTMYFRKRHKKKKNKFPSGPSGKSKKYGLSDAEMDALVSSMVEKEKFTILV